MSARWKTYNLSDAAKAILINSSILSIPTYYLSSYPVLDSTLLEISKIVRDFFYGSKMAMERASMLVLGVVSRIKKS